MNRQQLSELTAFLAVARQKSFTRAAAQSGVTPSALSHAMRGLEERLGVRLLHRTTRSVSLTEAGERLFATLAPRLDEIEAELAALTALRDKPAGLVRISADEHSLNTLLWPRLAPILREFPDIRVEIDSDYRLKDIVAERFDAGVRFGDIIAKDMVAVPIGPEARMLAVASPAYFDRAGRPQAIEELTAHACINLRLPTYGGLYAWEFEEEGRERKVWVDGPLTFSSVFPILRAALDGFGIACLPDAMLVPHLASGALEAVLTRFSPPFAGYHLYYPSRRQPTPALALLVDRLRWRG